jgi:hypothetical protein
MGSGPEVELFKGEAAKRIDHQSLVGGPSLVEGLQRGGGHAPSIERTDRLEPNADVLVPYLTEVDD